MPSNRRNSLGAAGQGGGLAVSDVFSVDTWAGTGASKTITNGIDLSGEGGAVMIKCTSNRNRGAWWAFDTINTATQMYSHVDNGDWSISTENQSLTAFNSDGFTLGTSANVNGSGENYVAYTFRNAPDFFEVQEVSHTRFTPTTATFSLLTNVSAMIIGMQSGAASETQFFAEDVSLINSIAFDDNAAFTDRADFGLNGDNTATVLSNTATTNVTIWAFDVTGGLIDINQYAGSASNVSVTTGFEPQFVAIRNTTGGNHGVFDTTRGIPTGAGDAYLQWNKNSTESSKDYIDVEATGFVAITGDSDINTATNNYVYMAIKAE